MEKAWADQESTDHHQALKTKVNSPPGYPLLLLVQNQRSCGSMNEVDLLMT